MHWIYLLWFNSIICIKFFMMLILWFIWNFRFRKFTLLFWVYRINVYSVLYVISVFLDFFWSTFYIIFYCCIVFGSKLYACLHKILGTHKSIKCETIGVVTIEANSFQVVVPFEHVNKFIDDSFWVGNNTLVSHGGWHIGCLAMASGLVTEWIGRVLYYFFHIFITIL